MYRLWHTFIRMRWSPCSRAIAGESSQLTPADWSHIDPHLMQVATIQLGNLTFDCAKKRVITSQRAIDEINPIFPFCLCPTIYVTQICVNINQKFIFVRKLWASKGINTGIIIEISIHTCCIDVLFSTQIIILAHILLIWSHSELFKTPSPPQIAGNVILKPRFSVPNLRAAFRAKKHVKLFFMSILSKIWPYHQIKVLLLVQLLCYARIIMHVEPIVVRSSS